MTTPPPAPHPSPLPELAVSAAWQAQALAGPLRTVDGREVAVIHRGAWTHGFGPDFRDALILFDGRELRAGGVEVHLRTSAWTAHGHQTDPRYDDVVLHAVLDHDGAATRRHDGALVPVLALAPYLTAPLAGLAPSTADWDRVGRPGAACAPELARDRPAEVRAVLWRLGDVRIAAKAARLEAEFAGGRVAPAEALYAALWDGLGYSANRAPMRALANLLPLAAIEAALATVPLAAATARSDRLAVARGLLLGAAGFLPLAPADAAFAGLAPAEVAALEARWARHGGAWHGRALPPTAWTRAQARPANHPAARLAAGAALLAATSARGGLVAALLAPLRAGHHAAPPDPVPANGDRRVDSEPGLLSLPSPGRAPSRGASDPPDPVAALRDLTAGPDGHPGLGADRAAALVANALLPFALALAEQTGDAALLDAAARAWELLPAADMDAITRRARRQVAGDARLPALGARGQQGLLHLDSALCAPRRCYECPIAHRVLATDAAGCATAARPSPSSGGGDPSHRGRDHAPEGRRRRGAAGAARTSGG